jgi:putative glutamine amidotransferase
MIDALILTGGQDVNPALYNEELYQDSEEPYIERDSFDFMLIEAALEKDIPILGICRGMQILNVYLGGTLHQDIKHHSNIHISHSKTNIKHFQSSNFDKGVHHVDIKEDSILHDMLGDKIKVNSIHHQCIAKLSPGLKISAISPTDKVIEAYESEFKKILGIQWHPEIMCAEEDNQMDKIFEFLYKGF